MTFEKYIKSKVVSTATPHYKILVEAVTQQDVAVSTYLNSYLSKSQVCNLINKVFGKVPSRLSRNFYLYNQYRIEILALNTKKCNSCEQELDLVSNFYSNGFQPSGAKKYKSKCKQCSKEQSNDHLNKIITDYFGSYSCAICNYSKCTQAIEFHHLEPKIKEHKIANMRSFSKEKIVKELEKGIMVCANCHREIHYGMHPQYLLS